VKTIASNQQKWPKTAASGLNALGPWVGSKGFEMWDLIGSPRQTNAVWRCGDTGKTIDPERLTQTRPAAISGSDGSGMVAKFEPKTENNVQSSRQVVAKEDDIVRQAHPLVSWLWQANRSGQQPGDVGKSRRRRRDFS
jgi:hypothetical protein